MAHLAQRSSQVPTRTMEWMMGAFVTYWVALFKYYEVIMNIYISNKHTVISCYFHYFKYLSPYVFIYTPISQYTYHYGGHHA